ncbi:MAG: IS4 family transposase [Planctomycetota bacterium]|nr:IS4 family transposase [Planctomycetota bacterium]
MYGGASFNDKRNRQRMIQVTVDKLARPAASITRSSRGHARAKAAYRLLGNYRLRKGQKLKERVSRAQAWEPVYQYGVTQAKKEKSLYCVQDTSVLMYPTLKATRGLGTVATADLTGLHMHTAMGVRRDGYIVGIFNAELWARPAEDFGKRTTRKQRSFEEKESSLWVRGADAVVERFKAQKAGTKLIHVFDRGGDVHEVLHHLSKADQAFIIRCAMNRSISEDGAYIFEHLKTQPVLGKRKIIVPRCRPLPRREATVEVRSATVTIAPRQPINNRQPFKVNVVWVTEPNPPDQEEVEAINWILYTTEPVETAADCWEVVDGYKLRWRIEEYHRVLKTDCHAEKTQFKDAEAIVRLIAILAIVAVRVLQLRDLARTKPDKPCTIILEDDEWKVLWTLINDEPAPKGQAPPTVREATKMIGQLGGHLGRKGDGMPGATTLTIGLKELETAVNVCRILKVDM